MQCVITDYILIRKRNATNFDQLAKSEHRVIYIEYITFILNKCFNNIKSLNFLKRLIYF